MKKNEDGKEEPEHLLDLRPCVIEFLADMREEDVEQLKEAMRFHRSAKTVSKFARWLILAIIGVFMTASQLGEAARKAWLWLGR